ncbi:DUF1680-domain-containing protein [Phellopilus nigrolimitatus]|nr:DUF1680-domain-containing protein [Phellopilus nigrolimitatus]
MPRSSQRCSKPVRFQDVSISSDFWASRLRKVRESSLPAMYQQMKETGRWDCLKLQWKPGDPNKPHRFWDSDIAKWLEAACYILTLDQDDEELSRLVESAIDDIRGAQQEDGYINSYYTVVEPERKWADIAWSHELYCAGHLLEAGLAHYAYSGSYRLLGPLLKYIKCIDSVFGPDKGKKRGYPGHEEIEIALTRAYEITDDDSLLKLAHYFITERGTHRPEGHYYDIEAKARGEPPRPGPGHGPPYSYHQADRTIREMGSVEGHSVRAMYWLAGAAGVARLTDDNILREAVERLWESTTHRKMYITGGLGAIPDWEGFGPDYYLPNESGYLETCAAIALVFFAHQMILLDPMNMEYAHVLELALYNAVLVGVSLDGKSFFYDNPLATIDGYSSRKLWFEVACCPANTARLIGSVGNYVFSIRDDDMIFVHLYISSTTQLVLASGNKVIVRQKSNAPWHGGATFTIESYDDVENVSLCFRIPRGCEGFNVSSSTNVLLSVKQDSHLLATNLKSRAPVTVVVSFKFKPRRLFPHPLNLDNRHSIAIARGPLIYCAETTDNLLIGDLRNIRIPDDAAFAEEALDGDGLMRLGFKRDTGIGADSRVVILKTLAQMAERTEAERETLKELTLIPYFMWANRGKSNLRVWLPRA